MREPPSTRKYSPPPNTTMANNRPIVLPAPPFFCGVLTVIVALAALLIGRSLAVVTVDFF